MKLLHKNFRLLATVITLLLALAVVVSAQGNVLTDPPNTYNLVQGWYQGQQISYYEFGTNSPVANGGLEVTPAPIYAFITGFDADGNPQFVDGQNNVVDVIPGDEGYSDLWEVNLVTVPEDYEANSLTSVDEILAAGYEITKPGLLVNCPVVPKGSTLEAGGDLVSGWYKGEEIQYFEFGTNPVQTAPIYALITGFDADGNPQFVEGQNNIVDVVPGDEGYSAFWQVNLVTVPEDYEANTITSVDEVLAGDYEIVQPGLVVNCPVPEAGMPTGMDSMDDSMTDETMTDETMTDETMTDETMTDETMTDETMTETPTELPATGGSEVNLALIAFGVGLFVLMSGLFLKTKRDSLV